MPLPLPLVWLAFALLAATALGPLRRSAPVPVPAQAVAEVPSPFGSGAALRNLLF